MIHSCVKGSLVEDDPNINFEVFSKQLHEKRWGEVFVFCAHMQVLLLALRPIWDHKAYSAAAKKSEDKEFNPERVTDVMKSNLFFAYLGMIIALGGLPEKLAHWAEACCYHWDILMPKPVRRGARKRRRDDRSNRFMTLLYEQARKCPMRGRRLAELVAGGLTGIVDELCSACITTMLIEEKAHLTEAEWAILIMDAESGCKLIKAALIVELDFIRRLPWTFAGLAHHHEGTARRIGAELHHALKALSKEAVAASHRVVQQFLQGPELLAQLDEFVRGAAMVDLALLSCFVFPFCSVLIVERYVEATHSLAKRADRSNHSAVAMSLIRRLPMMEAQLRRCPEMFAVIVDMFDKVREYKKLPALLEIGLP